MQSYSSDNEKGGVAKTTTAYHAAVIAAAAGQRVLLLDNDTNRGLTNMIFGSRFTAHSQQIHDMLDVTSHPEQGIVGATMRLDSSKLFVGMPADMISAHPGYIDVVLGTRQLATAVESFKPTAEVTRLAGALPYVIAHVGQAGTHDVVMIDNGPNWDEITRAALYAVQKVIVPIEAAPLSMDGLYDFTTRVDEANELRASINIPGRTQIAGVLVSRFDPRSDSENLIAQNLPSALERSAIPYFRDTQGLITVRTSEAVRNSTALRRPAWAIDPNDAGTQDLLRFGRVFLALLG